jgi:hypothetical protein
MDLVAKRALVTTGSWSHDRMAMRAARLRKSPIL